MVMAKKSKLILLGAPSGTGKTSIARLLAATDNRFQQVQVLTTRPIRPVEDGSMEKKHVSLHRLQEMKSMGELVSFNEKDGVHYGITRGAIEVPIMKNQYPVLEWDLNRMDYWDSLFPTFKVVVEPSSIDHLKLSLEDGRDPDGVRLTGVLKELELIHSGALKPNLTVRNLNFALLDTIQQIRDAVLKST